MLKRWVALRHGVVFLSTLVLLSCSRRAPSPAECVRFAELRFERNFASLIPYPDVKAAFDQLVVTCLSAPFDRRVITCAEESHAPMVCLRRIHPELFSDRRMDAVLDRDWLHGTRRRVF